MYNKLNVIKMGIISMPHPNYFGYWIFTFASKKAKNVVIKKNVIE